MQTDPIGYDDGMNMYAYVGNDPVNLNDPSGLCETGTNIKGGSSSGCRTNFSRSKGNSDAAMSKVNKFIDKTQKVADNTKENINNTAEEITPSRETVHMVGSITSLGLGVLSVTPYCGPMCAWASIGIDGAISRDLYLQGKTGEAFLNMAPAGIGSVAKIPMAIGKVKPKIIDETAAALNASAALTLLTKPEE